MSDWSSHPPVTPPTATNGATPPTAATGVAAAPPPPVVDPLMTSGGHRRGRTIAGVLLALLAGISAMGGWASFWATDEILSSSTWESTSRAILEDPTVQREVAEAISEEIVESVGVESFVAGLLPPPFNSMSGSVTDRLTELLAQATVQVVRTDAFAQLWRAAIRATHDEFVNAIDGRDGMTTITSRGLELDLGGVVDEVRTQLQQRGIGVLDSVDTSEIDVSILLIDAPGLERLRTWVRTLRVAVIVLPAVAVIAAIAALVVTRRRSMAVVALGAGGLLGSGLVLWIVALGRTRAVDELSGGVIGEASARIVVDHIDSGVDGMVLIGSAVSLVVLAAGLVWMILAAQRRSTESIEPPAT